MSKHIAVSVLLTILWLLPAQAQQVVRIVQVEHIAGPNIYLSIGKDEGISREDTLTVHQDGMAAGQLRVISTSTRRTVVTFLGDVFPITRGDTLTIQYIPSHTPVAPPPAEPEEEVADADRPSLMDPSPVQERQRVSRTPIRVHGRVYAQMNTLRSVTRSQVAGETRRTFATPTFGLRTTITNLFGGFRVNLNLRTAYRYSSNSVIRPIESVRVYQASIERAFQRAPVTLKAGRFYSSAERYSGYWDGLMVQYHRQGVGIGVASGFQPDRANEGFTADYPKSTLFVTFRHQQQAWQYDSDVSLHQVRPLNDFLTHTFLGLTQQVRRGRWRLFQDLQMDRNPSSSNWIISRLQLRATIPLHKALLLNARYSIRQSYLLQRVTNPFSTRRDKVQAGLLLQVGAGTIGLTTTVNQYEARDNSLTYASYVSFPRTPWWSMGVNGSVSYLKRGDITVVYGGLGVTRRFSRTQARIRYSTYRTDTLFGLIQSHTATASVNFPLINRLHATVQGQLRFGNTLRSNSLFTSLWMSF